MTSKTKKTATGIRVYCSHDKIVPIGDLVPNPRNPNQHPDEQIELLAKIIQENGWRNAITVSNLSGMIVKGHGRYQAAARAGLSDVPVDFQDYDSRDAEIKDLIADNKISELSEIDDEAANELIASLEIDNIDLKFFGYSSEDIDFWIGEGEDKTKGNNGEKPEIEFSEELLLQHNYIVLYFDDIMDWIVAVEKFGLKKVKDLIPRKGQPTGIGRVLSGAKWLDRIS